MFKIFCDETWTSQSEYKNVKTPYIVFYGIMLEESNEELLLQGINSFKQQRGLFSIEKNSPIEIKWQKVEDEWKSAKKLNRPNRYEEFLDIFFDAVKSKRVSFGYMFMPKNEYDSKEKEFLRVQNDNRQNFFFMLYFEFLYHCFIKNQIKQQPYEVWIDNHDMGSEGQQYEIGKLKEILNKKIYKDYTVKDQMWLSEEMRKKLVDSTQLVSLAESKDEPLVQLSDLCAGCVRYILENHISPPNTGGQISLFEANQPKELLNGKDALTDYFYRSIRKIKGYSDINLLNVSYHHRFSIFPFTFKK
ncbi:MAG: DUF3800 domain-containing protein [Chloroflexi bacterium]|nr:DUF3800 domain-containing protein [Chloroflexota bacterium]